MLSAGVSRRVCKYRVSQTGADGEKDAFGLSADKRQPQKKFRKSLMNNAQLGVCVSKVSLARGGGGGARTNLGRASFVDVDDLQTRQYGE